MSYSSPTTTFKKIDVFFNLPEPYSSANEFIQEWLKQSNTSFSMKLLDGIYLQGPTTSSNVDTTLSKL